MNNLVVPSCRGVQALQFKPLVQPPKINTFMETMLTTGEENIGSNAEIFLATQTTTFSPLENKKGSTYSQEYHAT